MDQLRVRVGGSPNWDARFPPRLHGMWNKTYDALRDRAVELARAAEDEFDDHLARHHAAYERLHLLPTRSRRLRAKPARS